MSARSAMTTINNMIILDKYSKLPQGNSVQATYVWIDGSGQSLRSRSRTLDYKPTKLEDIPKWNFKSRPCSLALDDYDSDTYLYPVRMYPCPFSQGENILVLCETYDYAKKPTLSNVRKTCIEVMQKTEDHQPWFGFEQQYTFLDLHERHPLGWPLKGFPGPQGPYYCGVGSGKIYGRDIVEAHYRSCLYAGISIFGINAQVLPSQWEFQVGPVEGITVADDLWMAKYILERVAEDFGVIVSFNPKPVGNLIDASAHCLFSSKSMRETGGIKHIEEAVVKLRHTEDNNMKIHPMKLDSKHQRVELVRKNTSHLGDCIESSIRIPWFVIDLGFGYLEDRRPLSNCDPYSVIKNLVEMTLL